MTRAFIASFCIFATFAITSAASAASLTLTSDESTYSLGELIVISVVGSSNGTTEVDTAMFAQVNFDDGGTLATFVSSSQVVGSSFSGGLPWTGGALNSGPGFAVAINQIVGLSPLPATTDSSGTIVLQATAPGVVTASFELSTADYFGATPSGPITFTIVPEPGTAMLLGLGLLGLATRPRKRS